MNKYIFLTPSICNVGGAEQYVRNKLKRLLSAGYATFVISHNTGKVEIEDLKQFENMIIPQLGLSPFIYTKKYVESILANIAALINYDCADTIFIESSEIFMSEWGELFAKKYNAQHICIILQENHNYPQYYREYLHYKYNRDELYGINEASISQMLNTKKCNPKYINADCSVDFENVRCDIISKMEHADYTVTSIGRLEKIYILKGIGEIVKFCKKHSDLKINLLLVGGGNKKCVDGIKEAVRGVDNLKLTITGFVYPLPEIILEVSNVFFSSAGSARLSMKRGKPTVSMDFEGEALGVLNYTTEQTLYKDENYSACSLCDYLESILLDGFCKKNSTLGMEKREDSFDFQREFERQLSYFDIKRERSYYSFEDKIVFTNKEKIYRCLSTVLGGELFYSIHHYLFVKLKKK